MRTRLSSALLLCAAALSLLACEDEPQYAATRGVSGRGAGSVAAPKPTAAQGARPGQGAQGAQGGAPPVTVPDRLKRRALISPEGWRRSSEIRAQLQALRDPFVPDILELRDQEDVEVDPASLQRSLVVAVPVPSQQLLFKGTLTGAESNLAMLEDSAGTGYTVRVGDIIGKNPEFVRVSQITSNEVRFEAVLGLPKDEPADSPKLRKQLQENDDPRAAGFGQMSP